MLLLAVEFHFHSNLTVLVFESRIGIGAAILPSRASHDWMINQSRKELEVVHINSSA